MAIALYRCRSGKRSVGPWRAVCPSVRNRVRSNRSALRSKYRTGRSDDPGDGGNAPKRGNYSKTKDHRACEDNCGFRDRMQWDLQQFVL